MDDLLALMGTSTESESVHENGSDSNATSSSTGEEESLRRAERLMCETLPSKSSASVNARIKAGPHNTGSKQQRATNKVSTATGSVDPLTKIRIVSRQTSKVDLVDYLASFQFHTTAALANMSKSSLATLIVNGNGEDSCSGRTSMATMGIVLSNSGTRVSKSNGRAFSILTLGDLHTGPTVSVFLFGHAYSNFTTKLVPGTVIAVLGSNLMPSNRNANANSNGKNSNFNNNETRISLSINDVQQVVLVGKAMDYGVCTGVDYRKQYNNGGSGYGGGSSDRIQVRCKHYVDTRLGNMCKYHEKQQQRQRQNQQGAAKRQAVGMGIRNKNMTFVQSMKHERSLRTTSSLPSSSAMTMVMPGKGTVVTHIPGRFINGPSSVSPSSFTNSRGGMDVSSSLQHAMNNIENMESSSSTPAQKCLQRAPMHMKVSPISTSTSPRSVLSTSGVKNPYAKATSTISSNMRHRDTRTRGIRNDSTDVLGQALGHHSSSSSSNSKSKISTRTKSSSNNQTAITSTSTSTSARKKIVPQYMEGFDGQVSVPKPNALFRNAAAPRNHQVSSASVTSSRTSSQEKIDSIRQKQMQVAQQLRLQRSLNSNGSSSSSSSAMMKRLNKLNASKKSHSKSSSIDDLLGTTPMTEEDKMSVLAAKSKFSNEANAELYAKSRQVLNELEKQESARDKRMNQRKGHGTGTNTAAGDGKDAKILVSEWTCLTCNKKRMRSKPILCIRANHNVKRVRDIHKSKSVAERRLNLKNRSSDEGGLVLGAGLEWSGWRHSS